MRGSLTLPVGSLTSRGRAGRGFDLNAVLRGEVLLWRSGLRRVGFMRHCTRALHEGLRTTIGPAAADRVRRRGVELLHLHASVPQLRALSEELIRSLSVDAERIVRAIVSRATPKPDQVVYFAPETWARVMAPARCTIAHLDDVGRLYGHLVEHDPHRDSWFSQAANVVNLWIALGRVSRRNSVLIYPGVLGRPLATRRGRLSRSQRIGTGLGFDLRPGDILMFAGDHLHSTALNVTNETRVVLSFRITVGVPRFAHGPPHCDYQPLAPQPLRAPAKRLLSIEDALARPADSEDTSRLAGALRHAITPDGRDHCTFRVGDHRYRTRRWCPHRGADLVINGTIDESTGTLHCGWHNLAFDIPSGRSSIDGAAPLKLQCLDAEVGAKRSRAR